jgi:hypothetical protein
MQTAKLMINLYDGRRNPLEGPVLLTVFDGGQKQVFHHERSGPSIPCELEYHDGPADDYRIIASTSGYRDAGFFPVRVKPGVFGKLDLMLIPSDASFEFAAATWANLSGHELLFGLLKSGAVDEPAARQRYETLMEDKNLVLGALLSLVSAIQTISLPGGNPLQFYKELIWDSGMQQDRFFAYADKALLSQVRAAAEQKVFAPEAACGAFHGGATCSYKEVAYDEANVQITFHENDTKRIDGLDCFKVETDMDYFKDFAGHSVLEVAPNWLGRHMEGDGHGLTDPREVYRMRWMAMRNSGRNYSPLVTVG